MNTHLLIIDPQNDFANPQGSLFVPGADADMQRLADFINKNVKKIDDIHVTLDCHRIVDVAHPIFWCDSKGNHPDPFTIISVDDVENGVWTTTNPSWKQRGIDYVKALANNGRYPLCIWPEHCLIGTQGCAVVKSVSDALIEWQRSRFGVVDFCVKGSNVFTENYSVLQADVPDPSDPTTQINTALLDVLQEADEIIISGEALSHCVKSSIEDIADNFGEENIKKFVLLEDTCSNVPGFENLGQNFIRDMGARGMKVTTSDKHLA
jgi:nicotinamidase-related amidase